MRNRIKRFLYKHMKLYEALYYIYELIFDFNGREHSNGKKTNGDIYYVIRPRTNCIEGLLSIYIYIMKKLEYALRKGYMPVIDMKNYKTQYSNGDSNVWEWYFKQPNGITLDAVYNSNHFRILSGYKLNECENSELFSQKVFYDSEWNMICNRLMFDNIDFSDEVKDICRREMRDIPITSCIGIYLRGTDYVKLKPVGENVQPTAEMVIEKVNEFRSKYNNPPLFIVTEDADIYKTMKEEYGEKLYIVSFDSFIDNYNGKDFLSKSNVFKNDMYQVGLDYLVKMVLLSKCKYLVSSITCGSRVAYVFNGNKYADSYIFDLGLYE